MSVEEGLVPNPGAQSSVGLRKECSPRWLEGVSLEMTGYR